MHTRQYMHYMWTCTNTRVSTCITCGHVQTHVSVHALHVDMYKHTSLYVHDARMCTRAHVLQTIIHVHVQYMHNQEHMIKIMRSWHNPTRVIQVSNAHIPLPSIHPYTCISTLDSTCTCICTRLYETTGRIQRSCPSAGQNCTCTHTHILPELVVMP